MTTTANKNIQIYRVIFPVLAVLILTPGLCSAGLLVYEGFDYGSSPLGNQNGGSGFSGGWYGGIAAPNLTGVSTLDLHLSQSLQTNTILFVPVGGCVLEPVGGSGTGYRFLGSEVNFDMEIDHTYYVSYLFRRSDPSNGSSDEGTFFRLWDMTSTSAKKVITIGTSSDERWSIEGIGDIVQTASDSISLNTSYFAVFKVLMNKSVDNGDYEQVFLKVYGTNDVIDKDENDIVWTLVTDPAPWVMYKVDFIEISGQTATGYAFDEIRIADNWADAIGQSDVEILNGDVNKDYYVNMEDVLILASEWLDCTDAANSGCELY